MSKQIYSDESLERYLLGLLPEAETERMDELSFTDDEFAQALKAVEKDLVDAYVQGELSGVNLEQFKTVYLASPLRRDNVQFARAFQALAARGADATMTTEMPARSLNEPKNIRRFSALSILWPSRPAWQFGFALVLLLLIVTGWAFWRAVRNRETKTEIASATPSPTPASLSATNENPTASPEAGRDDASAPVLTELNDGHGRLVLDQQGKVSGVDDLPPRYQELVKESLSGGRLERSSLLAELNRTPSPLMGDGGEANRISVIEPVGKILESSRPTFRWSALPGTTGYYIEIYDEKFGRVATSPKLSANSWTPPQFLKRGGLYSWQVKAIKDGEEFTFPRPPASQAKFGILDSHKANELQQARRTYATSHLLLGRLYAEAGLVDEAEKEFLLLQRANPDSALVRRLLSQVRKLRP